MRPMLILLQGTTGQGGTTQPAPPPLTLVQVGVVAGIIAVIALILVLLIWAGVAGTRTSVQGQRSWLDYGNFYVVAFGIAAVISGFLVVLLFLDRFTDGTQALGFLTALFGAITGLVGTYFGVKASGDARRGAEDLAQAASGVTPPTSSIAPPTENKGVGGDHTVTVTVTSVDGSPAGDVPVTFTVTAGPDVGTTQIVRTDTSGQATFTFTNNGTKGTDTIEATALGGKGTATVTFA